MFVNVNSSHIPSKQNLESRSVPGVARQVRPGKYSLIESLPSLCHGCHGHSCCGRVLRVCFRANRKDVTRPPFSSPPSPPSPAWSRRVDGRAIGMMTCRRTSVPASRGSRSAHVRKEREDMRMFHFQEASHGSGTWSASLPCCPCSPSMRCTSCECIHFGPVRHLAQ